MSTHSPVYGLIEAGGTKVVVGIATPDRQILDTGRIATTTPAATLPAIAAWLREASARFGAFRAIGVASFGPVGLDRAAADWGSITRTTKPGWNNTPFAPPLATEFGCPVGFDTDVNGAALAEARWGAGAGHDVSVYVTIGTGIGGGAIVDGRPLHGRSHPEMGHFRPVRHAGDADFAGVCPFHGDCLEGLASGPAIIARWGVSLSELPADHPGQDIIAHYLAQLAVTLQALLSPGVIILGGGVTATPGLIERARSQAEISARGYFDSVPINLVPPGLGTQSGLLGALALAQDAAL